LLSVIIHEFLIYSFILKFMNICVDRGKIPNFPNKYIKIYKWGFKKLTKPNQLSIQSHILWMKKGILKLRKYFLTRDNSHLSLLWFLMKLNAVVRIMGNEIEFHVNSLKQKFTISNFQIISPGISFTLCQSILVQKHTLTVYFK
jgi:hypothetical protein